MAWLTRESAHTFSQMPQEPDLETLEYWVQRLEPLIRKESTEEIIVVFCNRCGTEDEAVYAGTSSVIGIKDGEINLYGVLGRGTKELLVIDTQEEPFAKLQRTGHSRKAEAGSGKGYDSKLRHETSPNVSRRSTPFPIKKPFFPFRDVAKRHENESVGTTHAEEEDDDAWEIMSTAASYGSAPSVYSRSLRPPKSSQPKLGLQIPADSKTLFPSRNTRGAVNTATVGDIRSPAVGGDEAYMVPTPTAPSPTPFSIRPYFSAADKRQDPPTRQHHSSLAERNPQTTINNSLGGSAANARSGTKEKARSSLSVTQVAPSPPFGGEGSTVKSNKPKEPSQRGGGSQKLANDNNKSIITEMGELDDIRRPFRPRASSMTTHADQDRPNLPSLVTTGFMTAAPAFVTNDTIWEKALRNFDKEHGNGDLMFHRDYQDEILVGESSSRLDMQDELFAGAQESQVYFGRYHHQKKPSPTSASLPYRPSPTKSRNTSSQRYTPGISAATDEKPHNVSQSRTSIASPASPSPFHRHQEPSHSRKKSETGLGRSESRAAYQNGPAGISTPPPAASGTSRGPGSRPTRPVSRGRQPNSRTNSANGYSAQNSAQITQWSNGTASRTEDGMDRGRQHPSISSNRATESVSRSSTTTSTASMSSRDRSMSATSSWLFGTPTPASHQSPLDPGDEIVAMINLIRNDCPMHSSRAPSLEPQAQINAQQDHAQAQGQRLRRQASSQQMDRQSRRRQAQATPQMQIPNQQSQQNQLLLQQQNQSQSPAAQGGGAQEPLYAIILPSHIRELVESLSDPDPRFSSPSQRRSRDPLKPERTTPKFDPPTPTAMQFDISSEPKAPAPA